MDHLGHAYPFLGCSEPATISKDWLQVLLYSDGVTRRIVITKPNHMTVEDGVTWEAFIEAHHLEKSSSKILRKMNFLVFDVAPTNSTQFFVDFMNAVVKTSGVMVAEMSRTKFVVAFHKDDQTQDTLPHGLVARYVVPAQRKGVARCDMIKILGDFAKVGVCTTGNMQGCLAGSSCGVLPTKGVPDQQLQQL